MTYITWTDDLATGIPEIDAQHRRLVDYINELAEVRKQADHSAVKQVLEKLVGYTVTHFALEESLMKDSGYSSFTTHKSAHELFIQNVTENRRQLAAGEDVTQQLLSTLKTWLIYHIKHDDADYVPSIKSHLANQERRGSGWMSRMVNRFFK